jgi:hypothetical protein
MAMEPAKPFDGEIKKPKRSGRTLVAVDTGAKHPDGSAVMAVATPEMAWLQTIERLAPAVGIEGVRELMTMRREERALEAAREFNAAFAAAKAEFEPIVKTHLVEYGEGNKKTSYKHETNGDLAIVDPILAKHGIFTRYRSTSNPNEPISVTCVVSHKLGHSEETTLKAGADNSGGKNSIQAMGSTVTYLQRYTKILALGIATKHGDDDGRAAGGAVEYLDAAEAGRIKKELDDVKADIGAFCDHFGLDNIDRIPAAKQSRIMEAIAKKRKQVGK